MRALLLAFVLAVITLGGLRLDASTGPIPLNCDRACLEGVMDQFLAAVVAHDPKRAPLSKDVKYTENNQVMEVGDGFWKTAQGIGNYKHYFADPEFGQVAFMGTMHGGRRAAALSLRLRIELGRITEIESVFFSPGGGGPNNIAGDGQGRQDRGHLVQVDSSGAAAIPPANDRGRRRLLHRPAEERRQGHQGTGTYPFTDRLPSDRERLADHQRAEAGERARARSARSGSTA